MLHTFKINNKSWRVWNHELKTWFQLILWLQLTISIFLKRNCVTAFILYLICCGIALLWIWLKYCESDHDVIYSPVTASNVSLTLWCGMKVKVYCVLALCNEPLTTCGSHILVRPICRRYKRLVVWK